MKIAPLTEPIAQAVADFFDPDRRPSHYDLDQQFARASLLPGDPKRTQPNALIGKRKRVLGVLTYALDNDRIAGARLVSGFVGAIRGVGGFRPGSEDYVGEQALTNARAAFRDVGFELDSDGNLRPLYLDNLEGVELSEALRLYVRRARGGARDAALVTSTGKDLLEAASRHVLVERTGGYDDRMSFPATLYHAFYAQDLATPPGDFLDAWETRLDPDPRRRVEQTLYLLGLAVNKLRNAQGTGHGRPFLPILTELEAKVGVEAMGLVSELLLDKNVS